MKPAFLLALALLAAIAAGCKTDRADPTPTPAASTPTAATDTTPPTAPIADKTTPQPSNPPPTPPPSTVAPPPPTPTTEKNAQAINNKPATPPPTSPATASPTTVAPAPAGTATNPPPSAGIYSTENDAEIRAIFDLVTHRKLLEAEQRATALRARAPEDPAVVRIDDWLRQQNAAMRERATEEKIRDIDARNSGFNPTLGDLLTEKKDRGLPSRQDVRDAVQQIENTPYIPSNFGRTNRVQAALFDLESPEGRMSQVLHKEISVHLDNVTLEAIIFNIGQAEGINFVADKSIPAFKQNLSVNMKKVKLSEFLRYVSRNLDVQFQVGDDLIWIVDAKDPKKVQEETRIYKLRRGFVIPAQYGQKDVVRATTTANNVVTTVETNRLEKFVNDGAPIFPSIERAITNFFSGSKYMIDYERNLLLARGTREQLEVMDKIVEEFDKPLQQVLIEARFVTITEAAFLELGVIWETGRDLRGTSGNRVPRDFTGMSPTIPGQGLQKTFTNILGSSDLTATLTALQQDGESRTLSAPRLTLINNLPARISDGKVQYYYEEYTVKQTITERASTSSLIPAGKPTKITSGVSLDVLASIGGDGRSIMLALNPQVNQDVILVPFATITDRDSNGNVVSTFEIKLPQSRSQELETRVLVKSGQTVVMGGVLEREQSTFVESVPVLGRIPILGAAFRKRTQVDKPRYLLIFVTATLLSDTGEFIQVQEDEPPTVTQP